jgi:hypothetical protein
VTSLVPSFPARRRGPRGATALVLLTVAAVVSLAAGQTPVPRGSTFAIERHGRTVLLLEGVPTSALDALRTAVWARPVLY